MKYKNPNVIPPYVLGETPVPDTPKPTDEPPTWGETKIVGSSIPRVDAYERVSGSAEYTYDVNLPGMLYAAVLRCPHAHAKVLGIDISEAEKMPGVHQIFTKDSEETNIPWYGSRNAPQSKLFDERCRYDGDEVAVVAAESPMQAWDALRKIKVDYEVLPFVLDEREALKEDAPKLYDDGNKIGDSKYARGDIEKGFAEADVVIERSYNTSCQIHSPIETHGSVARWTGNKLTLWDSTQGVFRVMFEVAGALRLPYNNVRVICKYVGGAFGSKLRAWKQAMLAALLARKTGKPVKLMLTREGAFTSVGNRPASKMRVKIGAKKDGTLTAIEYENFGSPGAYNDGAGTFFQIADLYTCANVKSVEHFAYINAGKAMAMRAPGFPQCSWSLEQAMDELAEKLGMCPVELRVKNKPDISQIDQYQRPYTVNILDKILIEGAEKFGWKEAKSRPKAEGHIKRGVGCAGSIWVVGGGGPPSTITIRMFLDGGVTLRTGATDLGTGTKTALSMIVAEELGIPVESIRVDNADTGNTPYASPSGGSKTLPTEGPAARNAAWELKKQLFALASSQMKLPVDDLEIKDGQVQSKSDETKKKRIGQIMQAANKFDLVATGYRDINPVDKVIRTWGAHFAEVEVNTLTGKVVVKRITAAHESGRVINQLTYNNQVYGGVTMAIGFGTSEGRIMDEKQTGKMVNQNLLDYKIPTSKEIPDEMEAVHVDPQDHECNNLSAKGLGEPPTIPTAAAVANAIYDAIGVRVVNTPTTPVEILNALAKKDRG